MKRIFSTFVMIIILAALSGKSSAQSQVLNPEVFNSYVYATTHFDLRNIYGSGLDGTGNASGVTAHWQNWGLPHEGRRASIIFDPVFYLNQYSDLKLAFGNDYVAALNHFVNWGLPMEGRRGSLEFDVQYYLNNNIDLQNAYGIHGYQAAANHFLTQGLPNEGRQGSADFGIRNYLANYPDVNLAYGTNYFEAMLHWLRRGQNLGRLGTPIAVNVTDCADSTAISSPFSRIYIGFRTDNQPGTGTHADPFDGSTADKFDTILRTRSESDVFNLIVCILPGTYRTAGNYDWLMGCGHTTLIQSCGGTQTGTPQGFTLRKGWRIHGYGIDVTTLKLATYVIGNSLNGFPSNSGAGLVIGTRDRTVDNAITVSDMTIDDNYDALKILTPSFHLNLEAIHLRSQHGNDTIDHIKVINAAGEIGQDNIAFELFPVAIHDDSSTTPNPNNNPNNLIQYVAMSNFRGGKCTAILLAGVQGTMQFNAVDGYQIGYGVFAVNNVVLQDSFATNTQYGFNDDSLNNDHVTIQFNEFLHPSQFGIVIGGGGTYSNFTVVYNNFNLNNNGMTGMLLQGNVTSLLFGRNNLLPDTPANINVFNPPQNVTAFVGFRNTSNPMTSGFNSVTMQDNLVFSGFAPLVLNNLACASGTWDETSVQRSDFPDTSGTPCVPVF